MTKILYK